MNGVDGRSRFMGKVAFITGGARNIGLGIAQGFANEGADVVIVSRSTEAGEAAAETIRSRGGSAIYQTVDVQKESDVSAAIDSTVARFGGLHILINNAALTSSAAIGLGRTHGARLADIRTEDWEEYVRINITGPFICTKFAVPTILSSGGGSIINISSNAAYVSRPEGAGYGITKSILGALTRYTAVDYGPMIRCNELILGSIRKDGAMYDLLETDPEIAAQLSRVIHVGRLGLPSDVANACLFLCSDESSFITGTELRLDGGAHITSPFPDFSRIREVLLKDER